MHFTEIISRLRGISTPVFGVSWTPPEADIVVAQRVLTFLEDRRVLYNPTEVEIATHCVMSVLEIRQYLTQVLTDQGNKGELSDHLRAMRAACRKFLDWFGYKEDEPPIYLRYSHGYENGLTDWRLNQALGELRGVFGIHIAQIAVKYGLDVENQLAAVLPAEIDSQ